MNNLYEKDQIKEIAKWKNEVPGVIGCAIDGAMLPVSKLIQKVVPEAAIRGALDGSSKIAKMCTDVNDIKRRAAVCEVSELKHKDLDISDKLANEVHNWAVGIAAIEGSAGGYAGLPGMVFDIPAIITLALRTIHKIGICYGFEAKTEKDNEFILAILAASSANSVREKTTSLLLLREIQVAIAKQTWKAIGEKAAQQQMGKEAAIIALKNLAKQLGVNLTKRKALQTIPYIGAVIGCSVNSWFIKEVGWAARRIFQEKWLMEKYEVIDIDQMHLGEEDNDDSNGNKEWKVITKYSKNQKDLSAEKRLVNIPE